jgi:hypothetical protein
VRLHTSPNAESNVDSPSLPGTHVELNRTPENASSDAIALFVARLHDLARILSTLRKMRRAMAAIANGSG